MSLGGVLLNISPVKTLLIALFITMIYSALGGLRGVLLTDFFQFIMAMIGSIGAAYVAVNLPQVGGLSNLLAHENVFSKLEQKGVDRLFITLHIGPGTFQPVKVDDIREHRMHSDSYRTD